MITRLSLFTAITILFTIPCKAQQDTGKSKSDAIVIHYAGMDTLHPIKDNYKNTWAFSVSTDLVQDALFRPNIGADLRLSKSFNLCLNVGYELPSPLLAFNPLANGQFTYPGSVYNGIALRLGLKFYFNENHGGNYLCLQAVYKSISFNNVHFSDSYTYNDDVYLNNYDMSEKTNLFGGDLIIGHNTGGKDSKVCFDLFAGVGMHELFRNYTIFNEDWNGMQVNAANGLYPPNPFNGQPLAIFGNYKEVTTIYSIIAGVKLVFKYAKRRN